MSDEIHELCLKRIAKIFRVEVEGLSVGDRFGVDLKVHHSFMSENEMDDIWYDVYFVANDSQTKKLDSGEINIETIGDYCRHMKSCYLENPSLVKKTLNA